ncbi:hypothetical protein [Micromonospora sp. CPCC 205558]|uniref:hypothetical protein n=1 Tax=Micromonospora sp. CPCC 205558 TaxID=3122403 RepID=UPI002FF1C441
MKLAVGAPPAPPEPTVRWRPQPLDLVAMFLAVAGAACALGGLLPRAETTATLHGSCRDGPDAGGDRT